MKTLSEEEFFRALATASGSCGSDAGLHLAAVGIEFTARIEFDTRRERCQEISIGIKVNAGLRPRRFPARLSGHGF
ncbi:hypothetical protein [Nocardia niigatensis]